MSLVHFLFRALVVLPLFFNGLLSHAQSEQLSKHIEDKLMRIDSRLEVGDYDLALTKLEELESYRDYMSIDQNRLVFNLKKAQALYGKNEQEKAMSLLLTGLDDLESLNIPQLEIDYTKYLGRIFRNSKDYKRSLSYFINTLQISEKIKDTVNILDSYLFIGALFADNKRNDSSAVDSAIGYYKKIIAFPIKESTWKIIAASYNNLSKEAGNIGDLESAYKFANKSLNIKNEHNDTIGAAQTLINLSAVYYEEEQYVKALENYLKAYESVKYSKSNKAIKVKEYSLYNMAYTNEMLKDYEKAYKYLEQAAELTDSLARTNIAKNISEVTAKFNVEKAAKEAEEEKSKRQRTQYLFYSTIFIFITLLILSYIFYRNYRLKRENELDKVVNETQIKIINATIDAKEQERKSIAETLHDSVSALLSSANLHLQATKAQLKKGYPQEITKAQTIVNEASVKIRDLSHELISSILLKFGLAFAVHDMCQKYSNSEISLLSDDNGVKRYEQNFEIKIYNIIEELVNNILKHSKASNATIMLAHRENDMLSIRMNDDGIGFDAKSAKTNGGLGLSHIEARIKVMKGVFNIVSSKDNGTSIFILVPIVLREV